MSISHDHGSPVSKHYLDNFAFAGRIEHFEIQLVAQGGVDENEAVAREGIARQ